VSVVACRGVDSEGFERSGDAGRFLIFALQLAAWALLFLGCLAGCKFLLNFLGVFW